MASEPYLTSDFHPLWTLANGANFHGVNYSEPPRTASGVPRAIAWLLVALGSASFLFLALLQAMVSPVSVLGSLLFFLAFGLLEAGATWAAIKRHFGVSIALGGFVGLSLGSVSLGVLVVGFGGM